MAKKILSIDGGGIRGIIPAMILAEVEKCTKKPICELFDLIAGTSTGGILAVFLTAPQGASKTPAYTAQEIIVFYEQEGKHIFDRSIYHTIHSMWGLADSKYPSDGIKSIIEEKLLNTTLKDVLTNIIITSYEIELRQPLFFKSKKAKTDKEHNFKLTDIILATSAAPTYFEPHKIDNRNIPEKDKIGSTCSHIHNKNYYSLIDGGVYANNPAMCAYVEALTMFPNEKDFIMVSMGAGKYERCLHHDKAKDWGLAAWTKSLLDVVFDGISDTISYQLEQILNKTYYRFQANLTKGNDDMDDASNTNIFALKAIANEIISTHKKEIEDLCERLLLN
ncbi:MAG: patatin-like phospholipase family protein [Candidatus Magnetoovum sp. WYHC-5]|nr:patatin-like phospholipase family protein [Candidatus Magnetoovum sp. WYHC-5]